MGGQAAAVQAHRACWSFLVCSWTMMWKMKEGKEVKAKVRWGTEIDWSHLSDLGSSTLPHDIWNYKLTSETNWSILQGFIAKNCGLVANRLTSAPMEIWYSKTKSCISVASLLWHRAGLKQLYRYMPNTASWQLMYKKLIYTAAWWEAFPLTQFFGQSEEFTMFC